MQRGWLDLVPGAVPFMFLWDRDERGRKRRGSLVSVTTISQSHCSSAYISTVLRSDHYEGNILKWDVKRNVFISTKQSFLNSPQTVPTDSLFQLSASTVVLTRQMHGDTHFKPPKVNEPQLDFFEPDCNWTSSSYILSVVTWVPATFEQEGCPHYQDLDILSVFVFSTHSTCIAGVRQTTNAVVFPASLCAVQEGQYRKRLIVDLTKHEAKG